MTDPNFVIPFRLFGDGAESSSSLASNIWDLELGFCSIAQKNYPTTSPQENKSSKSWLWFCLWWATQIEVRQPWTPEFCTMAQLMMRDVGWVVTCRQSLFSWTEGKQRKYSNIMCHSCGISHDPRISCMSGTYCNHYSRTRILETIAWSFEALSISAGPRFKFWPMEFSNKHIFFVFHTPMIVFFWSVNMEVCFLKPGHLKSHRCQNLK